MREIEIGLNEIDHSLCWETGCREVVEGFGERNVDENGAWVCALTSHHKGMVYKPIGIPKFIGSIAQREGNGASDKRAEGRWLRERLPIFLVNPLGRSVGSNDHQRDALIGGLGHSWRSVQNCGTTGKAKSHRVQSCGLVEGVCDLDILLLILRPRWH